MGGKGRQCENRLCSDSKSSAVEVTTTQQRRCPAASIACWVGDVSLSHGSSYTASGDKSYDTRPDEWTPFEA